MRREEERRRMAAKRVGKRFTKLLFCRKRKKRKLFKLHLIDSIHRRGKPNERKWLKQKYTHKQWVRAENVNLFWWWGIKYQFSMLELTEFFVIAPQIKVEVEWRSKKNTLDVVDSPSSMKTFVRYSWGNSFIYVSFQIGWMRRAAIDILEIAKADSNFQSTSKLVIVFPLNESTKEVGVEVGLTRETKLL